MKRRTLLEATTTAWLAAGSGTDATSLRQVAASDVRPAQPGAWDGAGRRGSVGAWVLDWLPPAFTARPDGYAFGIGPEPPADVRWASTAGGPWLQLLAPHARLAVSRDPDPTAERRRLANADYERQEGAAVSEVSTYGRPTGRRYRGGAVTDEAVVVGSGPGREPVLAGIEQIATTEGVDPAGEGVLADLLAAPLDGRYQGIEIDPSGEIAGAADAIAIGTDRSTVRRVLMPESGVDPRRAPLSFGPDLEDAPGVAAVTTTHEDETLVQDVTVRTATLAGWVEGTHVQ